MWIEEFFDVFCQVEDKIPSICAAEDASYYEMKQETFLLELCKMKMLPRSAKKSNYLVGILFM